MFEVSNLNKVKESYTEESLQDPKRKVHKPVEGVLRLEIEKHRISHADRDLSSCRHGSIDQIGAQERTGERTFVNGNSNMYQPSHEHDETASFVFEDGPGIENFQICGDAVPEKKTSWMWISSSPNEAVARLHKQSRKIFILIHYPKYSLQ